MSCVLSSGTEEHAALRPSGSGESKAETEAGHEATSRHLGRHDDDSGSVGEVPTFRCHASVHQFSGE